MNVSNPSHTSPATTCFAELEEALSQPLGDTKSVYRRLKRIFYALLEEHTAQVDIVFRGPYPQTDYLLTLHAAPYPLRQSVHALRVRLRLLAKLGHDELKPHLAHDVQALCQFVGLVCGADIPATLRAFFPTKEAPSAARPSAFAHCVRMAVHGWDCQYFYGQLESYPTSADVRVAYRQEHADWSHLARMLRVGSQVNLVRPAWSQEGAEVRAELMVYEPDYLIDVSAIAACFENYNKSALVHVVKRITPAEPTLATTLGNMAGEVLDRTLRAAPGQVDIRQVARQFLQRNAIDMALLSSDQLAGLWADIQLQARHIHQALHAALPRALGADYQPEDVMVEAAFFAETLGIQGRMDFFQTDGKLILEQKSGKGEFPHDGFRAPRAREPHIVQLALYMYVVRYAFRQMYETNGRTIHSYLLYSKYEHALYAQGTSPSALLQHALCVRNQMAWCEGELAHGKGWEKLQHYTADRMNALGAHGPLWEKWQRPQLDGLLAVIHNASPLERAYFHRMLRFVSCEHMLSKVGCQTQEHAGFAAKWHLSVEDKRLAGNIYAELCLSRPTAQTTGDVEELEFHFEESEACDMANFRVGDIVVAYPYDQGSEPDVRSAMVFRCSISAIHAQRIALRLRAPQSSSRVFVRHAHRPWAIEHDFYESSFAVLYRGVYALLCAPRERRDLLLLQREPEADHSITALKTHVPEPFRDMALRVKQARDFFLIIGPPGTGKTSYGMLTTLQEELAEEGASVLLTSFTNRAVDEICDKLLQARIPFVRFGSSQSCSPSSAPYLISQLTQSSTHASQVRDRLAQARVVVGTTTALSGQLHFFQLRQFSLAIIDEASQILEPHLLPLLSAHCQGRPAISRFVMIGDHKQLPAVAQQSAHHSAVDDECLRQIHLTDCRQSLFERLLRRYHQRPDVCHMLTHQGRMHPLISHFPNHAFYAGQLHPVPLAHQSLTLPADTPATDGLTRLLHTRRVAFLAVEPQTEPPSDKVNLPEAEVIAALVQRIYELNEKDFHPQHTVGVIVPYRNQAATVRHLLLRTGIPQLAQVNIDTVERYQGSQRRYIVYGFTVQKPYQLRFLAGNTFTDIDGSTIDRKLNVAMTRAQECLLMVGYAPLLAGGFTFARLITWMRAMQSFFEIKPGEDGLKKLQVPPLCPQDLERECERQAQLLRQGRA